MLLNAVSTGASTFTVTRGQLATSANQTHNPNAQVNEIHDWLFLSVLGNGSNTTPCTGSCLYNYDVLADAGTVLPPPDCRLSEAQAASPSTTQHRTADRKSTSPWILGYRRRQVPRAPGNATTGGCAVQATQLGLN